MAALLMLAVLFLLSLFSCTGKQETSDKRKVFRYNEQAGISSLDPAVASNFENIWVINQLFNGLVQMNDALQIEPCIAKSWTLSEDGRIYTFKIRQDVIFHNSPAFGGQPGRKVKASDFVYTFERLLNPALSNAVSLLNHVESDKPFQAPDDSTFIVRLQKAYSPFLGILTMKYFSVIPKEAVDFFGKEFRKNPVGTGPFIFKIWEEGTQLILLKNPNYFETSSQNEKLPYLDAVSISFMKDKETSFLQLMKGDLDMISGMDAFNPNEILDDNANLKPYYRDKFNLQTLPFLKTDYLGFLIDKNENAVKNNPILNRSVRLAINYSIDREKLIKHFRNDLGIPATCGFIPFGLPSYNPQEIKGYHYNPDKVKELLLEAGYPEGKGLPEIPLYSTENYLEMFEFIQSQLAENNIHIKIMVEKASVLTPAIKNNEIPFFRKSWIGDYPDEENFMSLFYSKNFSPGGFNYTHYSNPDFDKMYENAPDCDNDSIRRNLYHKMDQLLINDAPIVPLYYDEVVRLVSKKISGLSTNPINLLNLKTVKKD